MPQAQPAGWADLFIGHWAPAIAVAAQRKSPGIATLFVAAQLVDWLFFGLVFLGVEQMRFTPGISAMNPLDLYHMPYTHSLLGSALFAAAFGVLIGTMLRDRTAGIAAGAVVLSHWTLDLIVHVPDLTLIGSPPKLGLGLWNHPAIAMPLELAITFGALWLYNRTRRPAIGRVYVLGGVLLLLQAINWFGPAESEVTAGTTLLAYFAYALATLAALWMGKSARVSPQAH